MKRVLLIVNPCAGNKRAAKYLPEVIDILASGGYENVVYLTNGPGNASEIVRERASEMDLVVCVGGDGTLNETIRGIVDLAPKPPIGYIPLGTTNDFATSLKLSRDVYAAARTIVEGKPRKLDVGSFNGRYFTYVASFGAFAETSYGTPQTSKNVLGRMAYMLEGMKNIKNIRPIRMKVEAAGRVYEDEYIFGAVSNATCIGGVLTLDSSLVDMNDGVLEMMLVRNPKDVIELSRIGKALSVGEYDHDLVTLFSAAEMTITTDGKTTWSLDGEFEPGADAVHIKNMHDAIEMVF